MNATQKAVIWVGVLLITGMGLYPPWTVVWALRGPLTGPGGHHWLFAPPEYAVGIDFARLFVQWLIVAILISAFYWTWPTFDLAIPGWVSKSAAKIKPILLPVFGIAVLIMALWAFVWIAQSEWLDPVRDAVQVLRRSRWFNVVWIIAGAVVLLTIFIRNVIKGYRGR